jgi:hypothetical protein
MANVEFCDHDWPGSGCPDCRREYGDTIRAKFELNTDEVLTLEAMEMAPFEAHALETEPEARIELLQRLGLIMSSADGHRISYDGKAYLSSVNAAPTMGVSR